MLGLAAVIYAVKLAWRVVIPAAPRPFWLRAPLRVETFLVGMATLMLVIAPVHMAEWRDATEVLARWSRFLPETAGMACAAGFLSGLLDRARPLALGFALAWPSAAYATPAWAFFLLIRSWVAARRSVRHDPARRAHPVVPDARHWIPRYLVCRRCRGWRVRPRAWKSVHAVVA